MASTQPSGPIGEAGATARAVVSALSTQPVILASLVLNLALVGLLYWSAVIAERERGDERRLLYENRKFVGNLLAGCTLTPCPKP